MGIFGLPKTDSANNLKIKAVLFPFLRKGCTVLHQISCGSRTIMFGEVAGPAMLDPQFGFLFIRTGFTEQTPMDTAKKERKGIRRSGLNRAHCYSSRRKTVSLNLS